jgi:branched-chain amino acid transport system permease protein
VEGAAIRRAVKGGLFAALAILYLALVGMIQRFDDVNLIGDIVTLGRLLIVLPPFIGGYVLARPRLRAGVREQMSRGPAVLVGAAAGVIAGGVTAVAVLFEQALPEGGAMTVFVSVTPALMSILTFDRSTPLGLTILVVLCCGAGLLGSLVCVSARARLPVLTGLVAVALMGMLQNVIRVMLIQLHVPTAWLYSTEFGGLTYLGAVVVFALGVGGSILRTERQTVMKERAAERPAGVRVVGPDPRRVLGMALFGVFLLILPVLLGSYLSAVLGQVGLFLLMGLGLNIVVGYAGLLDLGYVAFFAVGAYMMGVLTAAANSGSVIHPGLPFVVAVPIIVVVAILTGLLIGAPVLRLRGDYLAIVTLGFGEIARVLFTSDALKPLFGGAQGLYAIPAPSLTIGSFSVSFRDPQPFYYLVLAFCAVAAFVSWRLAGSRIGRAWTAMREDEQVAEVMGVSTVKYKLLAFATGAAIGSLAGALFAVQIGSLAPTSFTVLISIQALAIIILGGIGSIPGVIVGALVLIGLPGFLSEFQDYRLLIYGAVLVVIMLLRPQGLVPNVRRSRELREEDVSQDKWAGDLAADEHVAAPATPLGEGAG